MQQPTHHRNDDTTATPSRRRRGTILGVTAGVLGGGLVGLAMTVPTFTNAASQETVVALQETDDTDITDTDTDTDTVAPAARGERIREALQPLVDDATLTADQADAVAEHLAAQLPERGDRPGGHGPGDHGRGHRPGMDGEVVADLLGIEASELRSALRDGQTIADLAEANGIDVQTVIDALVAEVEGHLDLAVADGRLTEDEAVERLADVTERITARVNGERPARG